MAEEDLNKRDSSSGHPPEETPGTPDRRTFLQRVGQWWMISGLVAGYGSLAAMAGRYLFPSNGRAVAWQLVGVVDEIEPGQALRYRAPTGEKISIARRGDRGEVGDFVALSSTCPHLGCQVHWQANQNRFFCPCHNGAFDPEGKPIAGPPKESDQSLPRYPLKVEGGRLFIEVPMVALNGGRP